MRCINLHVITAVVMFLTVSCKTKTEKLFAIRHADDTGIDFQNSIVTSDTFNALTFEYIYNGSGIGVGDFNNDGLEDIFFGGNQVSSRLFLNSGNLKFTDVTTGAGLTTDRWVTGVSTVDINKDGLLDIFLAVAGKTEREKMRDLLFVNQGVKNGTPRFKELAHEYGIDDEGYGTMGAFFDFDKDGDLDLYVLTNALESFNRNNLRAKRVKGEASSIDRLYRNNGNNTFTNISQEAGILIEGYGLGVNICDINQDTWPDVYVSNDFMSNDIIWINQQNGTFKNRAGDFLKHQTHNGMGVDIADFNNDALADIIVVDMLPPGHQRQKMMTPGQNYDHFHMSEQMGYEPQYMRNTLQLNRGKFANGKVLFSEIAFMAGVSSTDWSWAPLFADFDNDGWKDLFIANGYRKDVTDLDFIFFGLKGDNPFGIPEKREQEFYRELEGLPEVKLSNYIFKNNGTFTFEDKTNEWGVELPTFSNGTAYADFDNDGDLDLVTNNIDQEVILYENRLNYINSSSHYVKLRCVNESDFNQKVWVYAKGATQYQELTPYRGFQSTVTPTLHFGLGENTLIDSIHIVWPDGTMAAYHNIPADTTIIFSRNSPAKYLQEHPQHRSNVRFEKSDAISYMHHEISQSDIKITRTLLHELSRYGPCVATADVNKDNLDDLFIGGEKGRQCQLFIQQPAGDFLPVEFPADSMHEDGAALFFDADQDGDFDLYVASSCASSIEEPQQHKLYVNDGKGIFKNASDRLPEIVSSGSCVVSADYDADGDADLFVGGRIRTKAYPIAPRSYILRNDKNIFTDVTTDLNVALETPGIISTALWTDIDNDKKPDLVLAGEWMPVRIFKNSVNSFEEVTEEFGLSKSSGWWNCIKAADLNNDGYIDLVAGNNGTNSYFQPTEREPVKIVAKDFDNNGSIDPIVTYYNPVEKDRFMVHNRLVIIDQIPGIKKRFEKFRQYAATPFSNALSAEEMKGAFEGNVSTLASTVFINQQGKKFASKALPLIAQFSTINDLEITDINNDGIQDILAVGNNYAQETLFGRYDASLGVILLGEGNFKWTSVEPVHCGFLADRDAKFIKQLKTKSGKAFVITNNNDSVSYFLLNSAGKHYVESL